MKKKAPLWFSDFLQAIDIYMHTALFLDEEFKE